jgi:methanogenic corrinoid protein MtbC1
MPLVNEGLKIELEHVSNPGEKKHIGGLFEQADPFMQEISYNLIIGDNKQVDLLTKQALDDGFSANTILDDGLIAGMALVALSSGITSFSCLRYWWRPAL